MSFAFKRFNFFQPNQVHKHAFPPNACCVVPGGSLLWVGTESGAVCILDSRLSLRGTFNAHGHKVLEVLWLEVSSIMPEIQAPCVTAVGLTCGTRGHLPQHTTLPVVVEGKAHVSRTDPDEVPNGGNNAAHPAH